MRLADLAVLVVLLGLEVQHVPHPVEVQFVVAEYHHGVVPLVELRDYRHLAVVVGHGVELLLELALYPADFLFRETDIEEELLVEVGAQHVDVELRLVLVETQVEFLLIRFIEVDFVARDRLDAHPLGYFEPLVAADDNILSVRVDIYHDGLHEAEAFYGLADVLLLLRRDFPGIVVGLDKLVHVPVGDFKLVFRVFHLRLLFLVAKVTVRKTRNCVRNDWYGLKCRCFLAT